MTYICFWLRDSTYICRLAWVQASERIRLQYYSVQIQFFTIRIPESEHVAGDFGVIVVETSITHSSPDAVVLDFQTSC